MNAQPLRFRVGAAGFAIAALYHSAALLIPAFARIAYDANYPSLRHIVFILVDGLVAYFLLLRPRWLIWLFLLLTVQVIQGHGVRAWQTWAQYQRVNWIDVVTVGGTLTVLGLLYAERRAARS